MVAPAIIQDPTKNPLNRPYQPFGAALDVFYDKADEVMVCGPSGTGKSRGILEKLHLLCSKYAGMRGLIVRKTRASLTQTAVVTYEKMVVPENNSVHWRTGEQEYRYENGSIIALGGMDKSVKIMSSEYDFIYVQEATELSEDDWETLTTRCRFGRMPYNQVVGDCNPSFPNHWIKKRADRKAIDLINSSHQDNPVLWDREMKTWTPKGRAYIAKLDALSGVRYKRLRLGLWAAAEGMIYDMWDPDIHMIDRFPIPYDWTRYWVVDFGFTHPFVWQAWAVDPENDIAYRFAEIYQTQLLVEDAAQLIKNWRKEEQEPLPAAIICDHDAEDRATLERHLNMDTEPALKNVSGGIQAVKNRLKPRDIKGGKCGMYFLRDSLLEEDPNLLDAMQPICTEQEMEMYSWKPGSRKDEPIKDYDHGLDDTRYISVYLDENNESWSQGMGA